MGYGLVAYGMAIFQSPKICFRDRNFQENPWNSAKELFFFSKFRLRLLKIQSPKKCNSIPPAIPYPTPTRLPPSCATGWYRKDHRNLICRLLRPDGSFCLKDEQPSHVGTAGARSMLRNEPPLDVADGQDEKLVAASCLDLSCPRRQRFRIFGDWYDCLENTNLLK